MTRSEDEFKVIKDTFSQEIKLLRNLIKSARPGHEFDSTEGYELRLAEMSRRLILIRPPITRQYDDHSNTLGEVLRMPISDSPGDGFPLYRSCSIEVSTPGGCRDWSSFHAFHGRYKYGDDVVNQTPPILDDEKLRDLLAILDQWEIFIETLTFRQVKHKEEQLKQWLLEAQAEERMKTTTGAQSDDPSAGDTSPVKSNGGSARTDTLEIPRGGPGVPAHGFTDVHALPASADRPLAKSPQKKDAELRSWTQLDLNKAIRDYKAKRASRYADLKTAVDEAKKSGRGISKDLKRSIKQIFGRNTIVKALGVRSSSMVSKSPAWIAIAQELSIELRRNRAIGTRHTEPRGKVGFDMAINEVGATSVVQDSPDIQMQIAESEETKRQIQELPDRLASPLLAKFQEGDITDEQARAEVQKLRTNPA